jgi:hypothetical protein
VIRELRNFLEKLPGSTAMGTTLFFPKENYDNWIHQLLEYLSDLHFDILG